MSARDKLLKSAPQEYRNGDLNHVSSAIVILDAIFQKHPKYKGDMTSDYFRVYDKNICEGKTVVPLAPTVVYLKDKPLLNDLPILCRDFFNATSWEINSTKYYYNYSQEVHLIIDRAPSEYLFISCSDLDFRFDSLLDWSLGGNRYWLQSLVLFQGNHYTSLVRIISTWYHFNDIGSYEKEFKFETVQEYMDSVITWKRLGSKRDVPHDTIRKWKRQVIKMYQDPSISALNREGNTILWDWIKKHLVMEGDEKTYPEILVPLKGPYIRRHIIGLLENKKIP
ncbi:hypothetical protein M0813_12727 [Anaeramoeba flamelloides]|uniref:Uncharacterized protein n=1 Tax=Anaeramoeba flamelloides TaxID=1746091 RepID=A0ABQ8ZBD5_9EUKA|nr:hypothetical protein M0813_12727 [Anaeramoeba flamelloides]